MRNLIYLMLICLCCGCGDFLSEYSQDMVRAKTVTDFDEVLIGSVYVPIEAVSNATLVSHSRAISWLNLMDDDVNAAGAESATNDGQWTATTKYQNLMEATYGLFTWQHDVTLKPDGTQWGSDNGTWNDLYARINYTNVILDELSEIDPENDSDALKKQRVLGETYFLRAQFYFILANLYSAPYVPETASSTLSVPLKLTPYVEHDKNKDTQFERATLDKVYEQIVEDLRNAISCLQQGEQLSYRKIYRANAEAAQLLLSRVYLYMQDWENARTEAEKFLEMNVSLTSMSGTLSSPFLTEDNSEILFSQGSQHLQNIMDAIAPDYCVSSELYGLYGADDFRGSYFQIRSSDSISLVNKYIMDNDGAVTDRVSDVYLLRVAEGYLNMAEACAMLDDAEANVYLNTLRRNRIGNYTDQSYSGDELIRQVREERRKELCFEGHRWFDLRRYTVNTRLAEHKTIRHSFYVYSDEQLRAVRVFELNADEKNVWTFMIPESVIEFDKVPMENNERDVREPLEIDETEN